MQIRRWLHLSSLLWEIFLCCDLFRKKLDLKNFFVQRQLTELYSLFDALQNISLLLISRYSGKVVEKKKEKMLIQECYALQVNGKSKSAIDLFLTNKPLNFKKALTNPAEISDYHKRATIFFKTY